MTRAMGKRGIADVPPVWRSPAEQASDRGCAGVQVRSKSPPLVQELLWMPTFRQPKPPDREAAAVWPPGCV